MIFSYNKWKSFFCTHNYGFEIMIFKENKMKNEVFSNILRHFWIVLLIYKVIIKYINWSENSKYVLDLKAAWNKYDIKKLPLKWTFQKVRN